MFQVVIKLTDVASVKKEKAAFVVPNSIKVTTTSGQKFSFGSLFHRLNTYRVSWPQLKLFLLLFTWGLVQMLMVLWNQSCQGVKGAPLTNSYASPLSAAENLSVKSLEMRNQNTSTTSEDMNKSDSVDATTRYPYVFGSPLFLLKYRPYQLCRNVSIRLSCDWNTKCNWKPIRN